MNVLLIYRSGIAYDEFNETYNKYKDKYNIYAIVENEMVMNYMIYLYKDITFHTKEDLLKDKINMKFDYIIGNPPYQDGKKKSIKNKKNTQNKLYFAISKKCLNLLTPNGKISFITPSAVCKHNKKFSLINQKGLKSVDFSVNKKFNIGVEVVQWLIIPSKIFKNIKIKTNKLDYFLSSNSIIYNKENIDSKFIKIFQKIKEISKNLNNRMFKSNNIGNIRSFQKNILFKYPICKKENNKNIILYYSKKEPYFYNQNKYIIPTTKSFNSTISSFISKNTDFDLNYLCINIENQKEKENIDSFIFSEYFIDLTNKWKKFKSNGFLESAIYLPKFDKTKHWSNNDVKEFFEELIKD